jgi:hypothetical protein
MQSVGERSANLLEFLILLLPTRVDAWSFGDSGLVLRAACDSPVI